MSDYVDPLAPDMLFESEAAPAVTLADKFGVPPFSLLDRRNGTWQSRKRAWLSLGIKSELGRTERTLTKAGQPRKAGTGAVPGGGGGAWMGRSTTGRMTHYDTKWTGEEGGGTNDDNAETSIFDPVLAELALRWFSRQGWQVLDPFAGGSVRGIVSGILGREYLGIDLRLDQVKANHAQVGLVPAGLPTPDWVAGDSSTVLPDLPADFAADMILTCPPYGDLEVYSDDPRDLSTMDYPTFLTEQQVIMHRAAQRLRDNRFMVWVTSDIRGRDTRSRPYRGLVADTIKSAQECGLDLYNDLIILDPVGSGAVRASRHFNAARKVIRMHQHALVFVKGDAWVATEEMGTV